VSAYETVCLANVYQRGKNSPQGPECPKTAADAGPARRSREARRRRLVSTIERQLSPVLERLRDDVNESSDDVEHS